MVNRRHSHDVRTICNESKSTNHSTDRTTKVRWGHHVNYVSWTKITWNVRPHLKEFLSIVDQAWFLNLKNLRAQVTHDNLTINRICTVSRINVDHIRVARLLLQFRDFSFQITRLDFCLTDVWICDQFIVFFSDVDVVEWHTVFFFYRVRAEEVHFFIFTSQFVEFIWYNNTEWEGLNTNFFIGIFFLSWKEGDDIWVKDVEVDNTSTLTLPQLVWIREAVFKKLHNWYDTRSCSFIALDRSSSFTKVAEGNSHTTTDTWKLKSRVDRTSDRVHIICDLNQETRYQLPTTSTTSIQEGRSSRLVALVDDFIGNINCNSFITISKIKGVKEDTVFHIFKIIFTVVCFQSILIIKFISSHERLELEVLVFDKLR